MKKICLGLSAALLVAAGSVQAAAISWSAVAVMRDQDDNVLANAAVILIQVPKGGAAPDGTTFPVWNTGLDFNNAYTKSYLGQSALNASGQLSPPSIISMTGDWNTGTINVLGGAQYGEPGTLAATGFGAGHGYDYYMLVFDGPTIHSGSFFSPVALFNKYASTQNGNLILSFTSATGSTTPWYPVPEPTTWALLGIGALAVGFRRKLFKK